ncbi:hypothetical protein [Mageeibacillus indolicus]|uniref:Uncharacterized protein n=2 Tax=Mageeibacillus indolicus TaxID=884684 RepID=D3R1A8_MAGIU|nr:hypothetical protein [Mageeibacillus indolicus]ADC90413.1 hypothetical protein HMPREF0868_0643 [Mageeibacillus indolicus UPII9-5]KFA57625.1 hypothetical protein HMPREF1632_03130 [Mageeibacillus indolicus 0009-5]PNH19469.1 hypothetical protein B7R76_00865 [Mageeibacillus indolicus]
MINLPFHNKIIAIIYARRRKEDCDVSAERVEYEAADRLPWLEVVKISLIGLVALLPALLIVGGGFVAIVALLLWLWT